MVEPAPPRDSEQQQLERLVSGGALSSALLFGMLALAAAFVVAPIVDGGTQQIANLPLDDSATRIDTTVTGSVTANSGPKSDGSSGKVRYTIRRSVIQKNPSEPCYIYADGTRSGDC